VNHGINASASLGNGPGVANIAPHHFHAQRVEFGICPATKAPHRVAAGSKLLAYHAAEEAAAAGNEDFHDDRTKGFTSASST
jgi:hypothetical protein